MKTEFTENKLLRLSNKNELSDIFLINATAERGSMFALDTNFNVRWVRVDQLKP